MLKDTWLDKKDGVDINSAEDINQVAHAVIELEESGGNRGENGATFTPNVSAEGVISWTNDRELPNPEPVNIKGEKGDKGEQGERGLQGIQGERGADGAKGDKGDKGDQGEQGIQGEKGNKGDRGDAGKSAYDTAKDGGYTGTEAEFAGKLAADPPVIPSSLPNPHALTINGVEYDGSKAVNLEITGGSGGGSGGESSLLGQTPYTLTKAETVRLVGEGDHTYNIKGVTVADASTATASGTSATFAQHEDYIEFKSTGGSAWYSSHVDLTMGGLTVGEQYYLILDLSGVELDSTNHIGEGHYILKNASGTTLVTAEMGTGTVFHKYEFTATTTTVNLICYPAGNSTFVAGKSIARATDIYINRASGGTDKTAIVDQTGTFTDSYLLGALPNGTTVTSTPSCYVYRMSGSGGSSGGSLPLAGKTVVCFGDSLFGMFTGSGSAPAYVAKRTGATVHNVGFGGCRMSVHPTTGYAEFCMWSLSDAIASGDWSAQDAAVSKGYVNFPEQLAVLKEIDFNEVDYIVIHYGTNDFNGAPIDNASNKTDYTTLCGALRYSVEKLLNAYPKLRIFVSLPAFRFWTADDGSITYSDTYRNRDGYTLVDFAEALRKTAEEYNLPVIDSYFGLGINKVNASTFLSDGVHHNIDGRKRFGEFIGASIIAENTGKSGGNSESGDSSGSASIDFTASVGQTIIVKEVDANGKPTKWESADYQPRTHWKTETVILPETVVECSELDDDEDGVGDGFFLGMLPEFMMFTPGNEYKVTYNGVDYLCKTIHQKNDSDEIWILGNSSLVEFDGGVVDAPFVLLMQRIDTGEGIEQSGTIANIDGSTTVTLSIAETGYHTIPSEYLPKQQYIFEVPMESFRYNVDREDYRLSLSEIPLELLEAMYLRQPIYLKVIEIYNGEVNIEYIAPAQYNGAIELAWTLADKTLEMIPVSEDMLLLDIRLSAYISTSINSFFPFYIQFLPSEDEEATE